MTDSLVPYTQLYQHFPVLEPFYTDFEKNFKAQKYIDFAIATWPILPLYFITLYALMIIIVPRFMKDRHPVSLDNALDVWNISLSLFSFCGMVRTVPHLLHNMATMSFRDTICTPPLITYGEGACGFWVVLFIFSKIPELVDTAFIVLRKSKLIFLHWYHHITVLLFCWHAYAFTSSSGLYFISMNYTVHAFMYGYYFLSKRHKWIRNFAHLITIAQISQMIVGTFICGMSLVYLMDDKPCVIKPNNVIAGGLLYGSYLYLFAEFFVKRFIGGGKQKVK